MSNRIYTSKTRTCTALAVLDNHSEYAICYIGWAGETREKMQEKGHGRENQPRKRLPVSSKSGYYRSKRDWAHLDAALQGACAHLGHELQGSPQLLPWPAESDHRGVGVGVAQALQVVPLRQIPHPVKQLPRPV